jgi:glycerophosphoryl diester phosphodiesterase
MKPFVQHLRGLGRTAHVSHRGGSLIAPENTLVAFRQAIDRHHTDQLEMDVHLSRDGVVVVHHDDTVDRTTDGQGPIADLTMAEIDTLDAGYRFSSDGGKTFPFRGSGVRIPRLADVLASTEVPIMIEIKAPGDESRRAVAEIARRAGAVDRLCLGCWKDEFAERLAGEMPEVAMVYPERAAQAFVMAAIMGKPSPPTPYDVLALPVRHGEMPLYDPRIVGAAKAASLPLQLWTVDTEEEMRRCLTAGVDGIQTDRPDLLRRLMG